jgi:hypothetical protein
MRLFNILRQYVRILSFLVLIIIVLSLQTISKPLSNLESIQLQNSQNDTNSPCHDLVFHDIGKIGLYLTNLGRFTNYVISPTFVPPTCIYPYPGDNEHLYSGSFWIGAVVGQDTLVSTGIGGWYISAELYPDNCPEGEIQEESVISHQDFTAVYYDTLVDSNYPIFDPFENRLHIPINVEITQRSYAWDYTLTEDFIILDFSVKNIDINQLNDVYIGIYIDGDVKKIEQPYGWDDDICGFKKTADIPGGCGHQTDINLAWTADADGKQYFLDSECTLPSLTGLRLIRSPSDSTNLSFNWWISNGNPNLDWGPRQIGTPEDPFRDFGGFLGTPAGDKNKYYIMSHSEIDYDLLFTGVDHTAEGWLPPPPHFSYCFAEHIDCRYLLSFGPFNIEPGQNIPITMAFVGGENFHTDPSAFEMLYNPENPEPFYNQLNFNDLSKNAVMADWVYDNPGIDTDGDGYYGRYYICNSDTVYYQGDGIPDYNPLFICGDVNVDGLINILDITALIQYLFNNGLEPPGLAISDVNNSGDVTLVDVTYLIYFLYQNGPSPVCF